MNQSPFFFGEAFMLYMAAMQKGAPWRALEWLLYSWRKGPLDAHETEVQSAVIDKLRARMGTDLCKYFDEGADEVEANFYLAIASRRTQQTMEIAA